MNTSTKILFITFLFIFGLLAPPAHSGSGFLGEDDGFISGDEEKKQKPAKPKSKRKPSPEKKRSRPSEKRSGGGIGPIVDNGVVKPMTALRYLGSFNDDIGLNDDQVYMAMGIIKQESWFKVGAKNKATRELINHKGLYDSDACVGLGQLMAVAIQDMIENDLVPMNVVNADPDLRDDFSILKRNIIPGTFRGKRIYRYSKKAVVILVTNAKISLLLSATFIKRTHDLLKKPNLTGRWYNNLIDGQQLKAVPMTYNAGIGRAKNALNATFGNKIVENVAPNLTGGADRMYYAKVTKFARKFKEMKVYDVAISLNKAIGLRPISTKEREAFSGNKGLSEGDVNKNMGKKRALAQFLKFEEGMSEFLTFDDPVTSEDSDFLGARPLDDEMMREFRKELFK